MPPVNISTIKNLGNIASPYIGSNNYEPSLMEEKAAAEATAAAAAANAAKAAEMANLENKLKSVQKHRNIPNTRSYFKRFKNFVGIKPSIPNNLQKVLNTRSKSMRRTRRASSMRRTRRNRRI